MPLNDASKIAEFYKGQTLLVTGATGFMGKILIEKLLRSCPDVESIYLLMRPKKNQHILERIDTLLADPVFARLEKTQTSKLIPIAGDISLPALGINLEDRQLLKDKVTILFHSAATVRFNEPLREACKTNVRGTDEILKLAKEINNLKALLYVSTAYTHCVRSYIDERTYETPITPEFALECVDSLSEEYMDNIAPQLMEGWPNTYAFSKALAENLVAQNCGNIPVVIFRPSIVIGCLKEPLPGWNDNLNGPTGMILGSAMGVIRTVLTDPEKKVDIVPVDFAINAMISSLWNVTCNKQTENPVILNFTTGRRNPLLQKDYMDCLVKAGLAAPPLQAFWYFGNLSTKYKLLYRLFAFFLHYLPALAIDIAAFLTGRKRRFVKLCKRIDGQILVTSWFQLREWNFNDANVVKLINNMSEKDRDMFNCDITTFTWNKNLRACYMGIRKYLLKDDESSIPDALKRYHKLYYMHKALMFTIVLAIFGFIFRIATLFL